MGSRLKEDEKNEKVIRGLLKQPGNRKCINCNMLGPQYVCTTFSTFICTTCSGIHREFTHRVKSVSMAKFTLQEIASLQAGGNERAREIYFKECDPLRNFPDSNNVDRLRDFIKHVYVHRRYTGERSIDRPPQGNKEEPKENRKSDAYRSGSQSPSHDNIYQSRYTDRASPGHDVRRSPGYGQDNKRYSDFGRSPGRSGVVNDWRREDRFSNGKKSEDRHSSDGESKFEVRSPDSQRDSDVSSPPMVRPVRDILGDNVVPLQIGEPLENNGSRVTDDPTLLSQRTACSSSLASINGNAVEVKRETSLIDFDAEPEPSVMAAEKQIQPSLPANQSLGESPRIPSGGNWASFDCIPERVASQASSNTNSMGSLLMQSSFSAPGPVSGSTRSGAALANDIFSSSPSGDVLFESVDTLSKTAFSVPSGGAAVSLAPPVNSDAGQRDVFAQASANQTSAGQCVSSFPNSSSNHGMVENRVLQASPTAPNPVPQTLETTHSGRKELPVDLFTATYFSVPYQAPGWQAGLALGMAYPMQYTSAMPMAAFPQPTQSSNPFDVKAAASPAQATEFPSMSSLNAALPNKASPAGLEDSALPSWISPQSSVLPGIGQDLPSSVVPPRPQGFPAFGNEAAFFGSLNTAAATPSPSLGGNPFD